MPQKMWGASRGIPDKVSGPMFYWVRDPFVSIMYSCGLLERLWSTDRMKR